MLKYHEVPTPLKRAALDHAAQLPSRQTHLLRHDVAQHPLHFPPLSRIASAHLRAVSQSAHALAQASRSI